MKRFGWLYISMFLISGFLLVWDNNSITGNLIMDDNIVLCKNTLDCSYGRQCCYFEGSSGGVCAKEKVCKEIVKITIEDKRIDNVIKKANNAVFFVPKNGLILSMMVIGLLGLVHSVRR